MVRAGTGATLTAAQPHSVVPGTGSAGARRLRPQPERASPRGPARNSQLLQNEALPRSKSQPGIAAQPPGARERALQAAGEGAWQCPPRPGAPQGRSHVPTALGAHRGRVLCRATAVTRRAGLVQVQPPHEPSPLWFSFLCPRFPPDESKGEVEMHAGIWHSDRATARQGMGGNKKDFPCTHAEKYDLSQFVFPSRLYRENTGTD